MPLVTLAPRRRGVGRGFATEVADAQSHGYSGEASVSSDRVAGFRPREALLSEDRRDQFPSAAHPGLFKDGLEVILHSVHGDLEAAGDLACREPLTDQLGDRTLLGSPTITKGATSAGVDASMMTATFA